MMKTKDGSVASRAMCSFIIAAALAFSAGCGSATTTSGSVETGGEEDTKRRPGGLPSVESEVGALDQDKVQSTLNRTSGKLTGCFQSGLRRVPFMGGEIKFALRIGQDGVANVAYLKESTLGDRDTESCMLNALRGASWPAPVGGNEGLAEGGFAFDPSADERPPVTLDPDKLGKALAEAQNALASCRSSAGAGALKATMYIDTDGKPLAVGVSSADAKGESAATCAVDALRKMTFPSPGSYAGKVSLVAE
jgi:hypothetical protein